METIIREHVSKYSIKEKTSSIPSSTGRLSPHSAPPASRPSSLEQDEHDYSKSSDWRPKTDGNETKKSYTPKSSERGPTSLPSQSSPLPSHTSLEIKHHRNTVLSKPKSILVKRSASEGPPNKGHDRESSQYRQSSISVRDNPGSETKYLAHSKKSFENMLSSPRRVTGP